MKGITWGERMIDTDKYEGHTRGPWAIHLLKTPRDSIEIVFETVSYDQWTRPELDWITIASLCPSQRQNAQLIADAPLLLEEVKRLREENKLLRQGIIDACELASSGAKRPIATGCIKHFFPLYLWEMIE